MSTVLKVILAATTDADNSVGFTVNRTHPTTVFVNGLAGAEVATLQYTVDGGANFINATDSSGLIQTTASKNSFLIVGPGEYRIAKSATVGAVAVNIMG